MNEVVAHSLDVFFNPCAQMQDMQDIPPFEVVSAQGVWLEAADGTRYWMASRRGGVNPWATGIRV